MSLLHDYFNTRNLQAFQRLLDGSAERGQPTSGAPSSAPAGSSHTSGGGGKSWNRGGGMNSSHNSICDVNARDWLGRTALHLACTSLESIEYTRSLLKHPQIDSNLADVESLWTPLHRALYSANIPAALLLLQRSDIDSSLKDLEGYTAFDLYNSTVDGTKPDAGDVNAELFTWGANRNAALGVGDGDDRTYPDHVHIKSKEDSTLLTRMNLSFRFTPIHVRQTQMSRLHTAVVTMESEGNLRLCGFGSGGRLGPGQHTQYSLKTLPSFGLQVIRVALGQDHTLALTSSGEVYSWGLNRFAQLGYIVEMSNAAISRHEEPIQNTPKRIVGILRKEVVRGVAASKNASACWTDETVFTWGMNTGQLGYDKNAQPIQVLPRAVTKFTNTVIELAMSDTVLAALLVTRNVECIWNDRHYRINFPMHAFPSCIQPYRPPQSVKDAHISKITCCDETFAALSSNGEVFTFSAVPIPNPDASAADGRGAGPVFKPQRVWALRKKFSAVKDVALGSDGSIIICTESGHVYVRTRNAKSSSGKAFKFERIRYLQRVTQVCANSTGAYGALRVDHEPKPIEVTGNTVAQDLKTAQPYLRFYLGSEVEDSTSVGSVPLASKARRTTKAPPIRNPNSLMVDDEPEDADIQKDIESFVELFDVLAGEQHMRKAAGGSVSYDGVRLPHDADTMVHVQSGAAFPVHRVILAARSHILEELLSGSKSLVDAHSKMTLKLMPARPGPGLGVPKLTRLTISGCHPLSVLVFLRYLYSDELLALWDRRVGIVVEKQLAKLEANPAQVKADLQALARLLDLPAMTLALEPPVKREPAPTMAQDLHRLFDAVQSPLPRSSPIAPDVILELADKEVYTHSVILRSRTPLFASFFDLEEWTVKRWEADGSIRIDMKHLRWHVTRFILEFMCVGADKEMFYVLDFINSVEDLLQFLFEIIAGANELLLDRLILICAGVILAHSNVHNACYVLADATYYHVQPLVEKLQEYISVNMESFLEGRMLDDIPYALVKQLAKFVKLRQSDKSPFSRSTAFVESLFDKHSAWLELQDLPGPIVRSIPRLFLRRDGSSAKLSPELASRKLTSKVSSTSPSKIVGPATPQRMLRHPPSGDEIFLMDEPESPTPNSQQEALPPTSPPVWKPLGAQKVDMKTVMAEAATQKQSTVPSRQTSSPNVSHAIWSNASTRTPQSMPDALMLVTPTKPSSKPVVPMSWRTNADQGPRGVPPAPGAPLTPGPLASPNLQKDVARPPVLSSISATRPQSTPTTPSRSQPSGLGPVITPGRQAPQKPGPSSSNAIGGKAWTRPPVQPILKTPAASGMSFVAIQHSQREQVTSVKDKRSLREIQEEEQSLQAEADFLKWWTAEEERLQQEALALAQFESDFNKGASQPVPKKPRHKGAGKAKADGKAKAYPVLAAVGGPSQQQSEPSEKTPAQLHPQPRRRPRKPNQKSTTDRASSSQTLTALQPVGS